LADVTAFGTHNVVVTAIAVAVPMRSAWPARQPSPKKSPGTNIATTASLPVAAKTESFTLPFCK
jgi:hypothetical protein